MSESMNIGEAADAAGVSAKMIRHYEQIGLMPAAARSDAGYRRYSERDVSVLRFIRQARRLGFSIPQIAELIGLWSDQRRASRHVKALAQQHVDELEQRMREMAQMRDALQSLLASCHGDDDPHCAIIDQLAVQSPAAPEPRSVEAARLRKPAGSRKAAAPAAPAARAGSHADLMAWTHGVHRHAGH
jgi:Cu(I)-responsive transcriptional regulator